MYKDTDRAGKVRASGEVRGADSVMTQSHYYRTWGSDAGLQTARVQPWQGRWADAAFHVAGGCDP